MKRDEIISSEDPELLVVFRQLKQLKASLDLGFLNKLDRSLPFADILFDRWDRANFLGFGEGTSIYDSSYVFGTVNIGINTWVGPFVILDGSGGLEIGDNCSISASVQIYSHDSVQWATSGGTSPYEYASTKIGNSCYIGPNSIIAKGVTIGDGCIIGANSFVNKSFDEKSKIAGNPAKLI